MDRPLRFVCRLDTTFRILKAQPDGYWLTDCDTSSPPFFEVNLDGYERVPTPDSWMTEQINTPAQVARLKMIQPLLDCTDCISDKSLRYRMATEAAKQNQTTARRILRLYYRYLATGRLTQKRTQQASKSNQAIEQAIRRYYYGSKRLSLRAAYEMMLLEDYVGPDGQLDSDAPTWSQFRHYFYGNNLHKNPQKVIAREGLTKYQRDHRPAWGSSAGWRPQPGSYQMDATQADIYLVSRADRSVVVGRPYIYLAVDTATHLIAGVYVGFSCDETAVMTCIEQAAMDKVEYCARYGIEITQEQWPSVGMPTEIITDQGREFFGPRMGELCRRYGLEVLTLPPFRPDFKGAVEKSIDLLQERYKPMLRGKGVIEDDTVAAPWFMVGLSQVVTAPPSYSICRQGCCRLMMYWPIILYYHTIPDFFKQIKSCRYGRHCGLAADQVSQAYGRRCRMAWRGSSTAPPVISWIQKNTENHFGIEYIRFLCSLFARCTELHSLLCPSNSHGCLSFFCRSYQFTVRRLIPRRKPHGWSR